jgi:hypothetical protein
LAVLLLAAGVVIGHTLAWICIAVALTVVVLLAAAEHYAKRTQPTTRPPNWVELHPPNLKRLLSKGYKLESAVMSQALTSGPSVDEQVRPWARAVWEAMCDEHPQEAREFFGDGAPYEGPYFGLAYATARGNNPLGYLRSRIQILARVVGGSESVPAVRHHVDRPLAMQPESPTLVRSISRGELKAKLEGEAKKGRWMLRKMSLFAGTMLLGGTTDFKECNEWIDRVEVLLDGNPRLLRMFRKSPSKPPWSLSIQPDARTEGWFEQRVANLEEIVSLL